MYKLLRENIIKHPITRLLIRKGYWEKLNSNTQPSEYWSARATEEKQILKYPAPEFWSARASERKQILIPSFQNSDLQGLLKKKTL